MIKMDLNNEYFEWMYQLVCDEKYSRGLSYRKLLTYLHDTNFTYTIHMDGNRAEDGISFRYRFGYECKYERSMIDAYLSDKPCSIFEMMVALSMRCEEHIMDDPNVGNRTGQWFWNMIVNLGLGSMNDAKFDKKYTNDIISRFLNREYGQNGEGGLFTVEHCKHDLRTIDIWYQMCWYLDSIL